MKRMSPCVVLLHGIPPRGAPLVQMARPGSVLSTISNERTQDAIRPTADNPTLLQ